MREWLLLFLLLPIGHLTSIGGDRPVPVMLAMRLSSECSIREISRNIEVYRKYPLQNFVIEVPLRTLPEQEFRYYETSTLDTLIFLLRSYDIPYSLAFFLQEEKHIVMEQVEPDIPLMDMSGYLLRTEAYPPKQLIIMESMLQISTLKDFVMELRRDFTAFSGDIVFAASPEFLQSMRFDWETPDAVGVIYAPPLDQSYPKYFKEVNEAVSIKAEKYNKSVLICQANIIGDDKLELFRAELRFWSKDIYLKGIILNALDCNIPLMESGSIFSLAEDEAFLQYLARYGKKIEPKTKKEEETFY